MTTITALPTPPSRADAANFSTRADAFHAALPTFATECNTVAGEVVANANTASSAATTAGTNASTATTQAANALASANAAAASALTAINAPGTNAISTTSVAIGTGSKTLTIQAGKDIVAGMSVVIAYTSAPTSRMLGTVISYDSGTGSLVVSVTAMEGSGTYAAWTVSLATPPLMSSLVTAMAALAVDCSVGTYFTKTISTSSEFTFTNPPASGAYAFTLELTHTSGTITWPATVKWSGDVSPTLTTGKTHLFTFITDDGGSRWRGIHNINYAN